MASLQICDAQSSKLSHSDKLDIMQAALLPFAEGVLAAGYNLVFCGFRAGGAKAQHATVKLLQHLGTANQNILPIRNVMCVTFGTPQILKIEVKHTVQYLASPVNVH